MASTRPAFRAANQPALAGFAYAAMLTAILVAALYYGRGVFVPLALAVLLSFVLSPIVVGLRKLYLPRLVAVVLVVAGFVTIIIALGMGMARQVNDLASDLPRYESTLREKLKSLRKGTAQTGLVDKATSTLKELGRELEQSTARPDDLTTRSGGGSPTEATRPIPVEVRPPPERPLETYQRIVSVLISPLTTTAIVLILIVFILLQREDIRDRVIRLVGAGDIELTTTALNDAAYRLSRLFLAQAILNAGFGTVIAIGLWLIGVPSALLWGIVAALFRFIPYVGAILAAVFPVLLAAAVDPGWSMVVLTLALYVIIEPIVGHFLEPWIQGQTTGLSPLAIVVSAIVWTALWGPIGLLLATPLTICLVVLGRHVDGLSFLDVILGDEPALTPPETFYQRMLAGSSAEAAEQAYSILKETTLVDYYDVVALPGLKLASLDEHRGAIDRERMTEVHDAVRLLMEDLGDVPLHGAVLDGPASAEKSEGERLKANASSALAEQDTVEQSRANVPSVLCLPARTPLDAAAAEILSQLLGRHGVRSRSEAGFTVSGLGRLDLTEIRVVWISSLDAAQSNAQIRYLIRRLRRIAPDVVFCGGFWDGSASDDTAMGARIEHHASTFAGAIDITIALAAGAQAKAA